MRICRFAHRWPLAVGGFRCSNRGRHRHFLVIGALQVRGGLCLGSTLCHPGAGHQSVESGVAGQDASARGCVVRRQLCRHDVDGAPRRPVLDAALVGLDFRSPVRWFRPSRARFRRTPWNHCSGVGNGSIGTCPVGANKCDQLAKGCLAATLLRDSEVARILNKVAPARSPALERLRADETTPRRRE